MYNFIDVNEVSEGNNLPSEALQINGEYIEHQIKGYRTLRVSGRESLSPELDSYETGIRDGSVLKNKRYPARTIIVEYQLICGSNEEFREAYNMLGKILNVENAELIFADEPDKFYIGTPAAIGDVEPGRNAVTGEIELFCADPFKYSVVEYEAEPWEDDKSSVLIDYNGTYKAYPILEADFYTEEDVNADGSSGSLTGNGDCGYVAFFTEDEKIIQLGDPDEVDGENEYEKSQTLMNQTFLSGTAWGTTAKNLWSLNSGVVLPSDVVQTGDVGMIVSDYANNVTQASTQGTLLSNKLSAASSPKIYYTVKAKATCISQQSVRIEAVITASLGSSESYFGQGYGLIGHLYVGNAWQSVTIKRTSEYWKGKTGHTVNITFTHTVSGVLTNTLKGIKFKVTRSDTYGSAGILAETACNDLALIPYADSVAERYYLKCIDYGTGDKWHGASITRNVPADASGVIGASNFTFSYRQKMCVGVGSNATQELGGFHACLSSSDGTVVAGVRVVKNQAGNAASLMLYVNNVKVHQVGIDLSNKNKFFSASGVKTSVIKKVDSKVIFNIAGYRQTFKDDAIKNTAVTKVTFMFERYGSNRPLSYNGLHSAKFVKDNCNTNIPNKFGANDVLEADCKDGEIYLNGVNTPDLGALGNDWEGFYLTPGLNQIGIAYSNWVQDDYAPSFKVRYREVFL